MILGLIYLLILSSVFAIEKKDSINDYWPNLFTEPCEKIIIFMKDEMIFEYAIQSEVKVNMSIGILEKKLRKFKGKNYSIKEIKLVIHNHRRKNYFSRSDYKQYRMLKKYRFNGRFLMYCHRTNKTYDIKDKAN